MSTERYVINLFDINTDEIHRVGGKALNLGFLIKNGFNVPNGFVVTTEAYKQFIKTNQLEYTITSILLTDEPENASKRIQEVISTGKIPPEVQEAIIKQYDNLGMQGVAVRSSATSEDLQDASFAGQMDTYLNINTQKDVIQHIKRCYMSLWTSRAISYRAKQGIDSQSVSIAVVVQEIIEPNEAGVMFTQDPVTSEDSIVIESNYGFGESVVSGRATPDRFIVRLGPVPEIKVREIGTKELEAVKASNGGLIYSETSIDRREQSSLTDKEIFELASLGEKIEAAYGSPQDIEWAISNETPYLLQSRPITTINGSRDLTPWTRGYSDDYWNDNVTPLFFELLGDHISEIVNVELNELLGYTEKGDAEMDQLLRLHKAHAYFNLEVLKRKVEYEIPSFLRNNDVLNYFPEGEGPYGKETMKRLPFRLSKRINAEYRIRTRDPDGASSRTADAYDQWTHEVLNPFWRSFDERMKQLEGESLNEYLAFTHEVNDIMITHYRLVRYGLPVHNIGMNLMSQYLLKRFIGEEKAAVTYPILVSGLKHSTSKTNDSLFQIAEIIRGSPSLRSTVIEAESKQILEKISSLNSDESARFLEAFNNFLYDYGCRGFTREPLYPRWSEAPEYVFDIMKSLVVDEGSDLASIEEKNRIERERVENELRENIGNQRFGYLKNKLLGYVIGTARRYIVFREEQRYNLDKWITMNRVLYMKIGKILTEKGILSESSDIFFLQKKEIETIINGNETLPPKLIEQRRTEYQRYENITPPKFLEGDREYNDPYPPSAKTYKGLPASQGILTGPVRVLKSIKEIWRVRTGEILVVPRTDPGWTPVFSKIGGLITETGGVLSHGAVVSREYGVPAVTNISNACRIFQTGQIVTINGANGSVSMDD